MVGTQYTQNFIKSVAGDRELSALEEYSIGWLLMLTLDEVMPGNNLVVIDGFCWEDRDKKTLEFSILYSSGVGIDELDSILKEHMPWFKGVMAALEYIRINMLPGVSMARIRVLMG